MQRIHQELQTLAGFSSGTFPAITRILYSQADLDARTYFIDLCQQAGLKVRTDPIGNIFARWEGTEPALPPVGTGSHIDAIPQSGQYDGTVGVFGGLEAIRILQEQGYQPKRSIEVLLFTSEEPTRFGIGCLGSRMLSGQLGPRKARELKDNTGKSLDELRKSAGYTGDLEEVILPDHYYAAFVELHIEQGPVLERDQLDIGIVTKIAAPSTLSIQLKGEGGHAGCVLMPDRRDAGVAGAEITLAAEKIALESHSPDTVATTGIFQIEPGAVNSIPWSAYLEIDLRDTQTDTRDKALNDLQKSIKAITKKRKVSGEVTMLNCDPPAICSDQIIDSIEKASITLGFRSKKMISRAYHDSLFMAQLFPTAMIFIPCKDGISHRPDEYSSPEQIDKGVQTLAQVLKELSG